MNRPITTVVPILICLLFLSLLPSESSGQYITWDSEDLENTCYYPEKKLYAKHKIRFQIDSNEYLPPRKLMIEAYDTKGRIIGLFSHSVDSFINPFRYYGSGDTLVRTRLLNSDGSMWMLEKFIYNKKGQIVQFDRCYDDFSSKGRLNYSRTVFYYANDHVSDKLQYTKNIRAELTQDLDVATDSMKLWSMLQYSYVRHKERSMMIIHENIGTPESRCVDSFIYDNKKRLVRHTSFVPSAYLFCSFRASDVRRIEDYEYRGDSVLFHGYTTTKPNFAGQAVAEQNTEYRIRIYNKEGLEIRNLYGTEKDKISVHDRTAYIRY